MPPSSATLLDNFFCFSLHTGSVVLGWLGLSSAIISVISWSVSYQNIDGFIKEHFNVTGNDTDDTNWQPADIYFMRNAAVSIISMLIGFYIIECLASIFLIHGASNNKRMYLVPWLVERGTQLFFYMMVILAMGLYFFTSMDTIKFSLITIVFGGFYLSKYNLTSISVIIPKPFFFLLFF